jgi:hypothetical protein
MRRLKEDKACGDDDIPVEFYEAVMEARVDLYNIVRRVFATEEIPANLVVVLFIMFYKGSKKGTVNEFPAYRPIGLARHAFKIIDVILMEELAEDTELFLSPAQDGSRANRGARGNILRKRLFISSTLELGMEGVITLLDYSGAFDATAQSFTNAVLGKAGAIVKLRALYHSLLKTVRGKVRMRAPDGADQLSGDFALTRGGIQGLNSTPWVFILSATEILAEDDEKQHDLDFAIRRECLRLECLASGGERWFAGGAGEGRAGAPDEAAAEEGERRWNHAVLKGGKALFAARAQASKLLEEQKAEIAQAELRPARWAKDDADEEDVTDAEAT